MKNLELNIKNLSNKDIILKGSGLLDLLYDGQLEITVGLKSKTPIIEAQKLSDFRVCWMEASTLNDTDICEHVDEIGIYSKLLHISTFLDQQNQSNHNVVHITSLYVNAQLPPPVLLSELIIKIKANAEFIMVLSPIDVIYPYLIGIENREVDLNMFSNRYSVQIKNKANSPKKAILFGFGEFWNKSNYGSESEIEIICSQTNVEYGQLISESAFSPFEVGLTRINVKNKYDEFYTNQLFYHSQKATGHSSRMPIPLKELDVILKDRNQRNQLKLLFNYNISSTEHLELIIPPNEIVHMDFFPLINKSS